MLLEILYITYSGMKCCLLQLQAVYLFSTKNNWLLYLEMASFLLFTWIFIYINCVHASVVLTAALIILSLPFSWRFSCVAVLENKTKTAGKVLAVGLTFIPTVVSCGFILHVPPAVQYCVYFHLRLGWSRCGQDVKPHHGLGQEVK